MNILVCEKNFVGFLSAVYDSYYTRRNADTVTSDINDVTLADSFCASTESREKARRVRDGLIKKGGMFAYDSVLDAYLSGDKLKEKKIFDFLRLFFARGRAAFEAYDDPRVTAFNDLVRKVRHEIHRVSAFVRFQETRFSARITIFWSALPKISRRGSIRKNSYFTTTNAEKWRFSTAKTSSLRKVPKR